MKPYNFNQPTLMQEFNRPLKADLHRPIHDRVLDGRGRFKSPDQLFAEKYYAKLYGSAKPDDVK